MTHHRQFDADAWVRANLGVLNENGGRGYDAGVRIVNCPWCNDSRGKGWVNVVKLRMACFEPHCPAHTGMNLVQAVQHLQGFTTWTEALMWLRHEYPYIGPPALPPKPPTHYTDWVKWPTGGAPLIKDGKPTGVVAAEALRFATKQWGITALDAQYWELRYCTSGRYAWRIIIPVKLNGQPVAFLARTFRDSMPKYLSSTYESEMGRPGEAILFNLDAVRPGQTVALVEGAGDVMASCSDSRWNIVHRIPDLQMVSGSGAVPIPVALLGTQITDEKAALLAGRAPGPVIIALDADLPSTEAMAVYTELFHWGLDARLGTWRDGKDAGAGGTLSSQQTSGLTTLVSNLLRRTRR